MSHQFDDKWLMQYKLPKGDLGREVAAEMNEHHCSLWRWGLENVALPQKGTILDVGCGGGGALKLMGDTCCGEVRFVGVDLSGDMARMAAETCSDMVSTERLMTRMASVSDLPFQDNTFAMVTAFETIYFWNDLPQALREIKRILQPGGKILVVNEMSDTGEKMCEIHQRAHDLMNMYIPKPTDLMQHFIEGGFDKVELFEHKDKPWIAVCGQKRGPNE